MDSSLRSLVESTLAANRVSLGPIRYTRPAQHTYPHQWLWDSCFHALIYQKLGAAELAKSELRALFREQVSDGPDCGRLPHMTFLGANSAELSAIPRSAEAYARDVQLWQHTRSSSITQPPLLAESVLALKDPPFWREVWNGLCAYYDWWLRRRTMPESGLVAIWHLWESGADATPRGDNACQQLLKSGKTPRFLAMQTVNPTAHKRQDLLAARFLMLEALQAIDRDELAEQLSGQDALLARRQLLGLVSIEMQAYLIANLNAMAELGTALQDFEPVKRYRSAAQALAMACNKVLWDEAAAWYQDQWSWPVQKLSHKTFAPFIALYAPGLVPEERAQRLLQHLLDPKQFWTRWPVPTVAISEREFNPDEYWRGSTWINVNWFIVRGLLRCAQSFKDEAFLRPAKTIALRSLELVQTLGLREYYRSQSAPNAAEAAGFGPALSWSGLALCLEALLEGDLANIEEYPAYEKW